MRTSCPIASRDLQSPTLRLVTLLMTLGKSQHPAQSCANALQATSNHTRAQNGSIFFMSSDSFSYSGQNNDSRGIPSIRAWAITNTSLLSLVCSSPLNPATTAFLQPRAGTPTPAIIQILLNLVQDGLVFWVDILSQLQCHCPCDKCH